MASGRLRTTDLNQAERMVVHAIRSGLPQLRQGAHAVAVTAEDQDELLDLSAAVERYLHRLPPGVQPEPGPSNSQLGAFEEYTLRALACLQAGLLGEAWKSLVPVCGDHGAGKTLELLQEVADVLQWRSRRIERWAFEPACFREAGLI
jgi:hypothetical protein